MLFRKYKVTFTLAFLVNHCINHVESSLVYTSANRIKTEQSYHLQRATLQQNKQ